MADVILLVDRLMKSFGGLRATNDLSLEVLRGEWHNLGTPAQLAALQARA